MYTFNDVRKFLENASVDDVGFHTIPMDSLARHIQIYQSKRECNIIASGTIPEEGFPIGKLLFDGDEVSMIRVVNGYANYDDVRYIPADTQFEDNPWFHGMCINAFGTNGRVISSTILKMAILGSQMK